MNPVRSESGPALLRQALSELHREAWAWALNCCDRNRADAEDVLHTTYVKILDGRARFDGRSSLLTWLFAVIRMSAADLRRRRYLREIFVASPGEDRVDDARPSPQESAEAAELRQAVVRALATLARRQREVLLLVFYHELTVEQAAQVMGVHVGTARQHYARGKAALAAILDAQGIRP